MGLFGLLPKKIKPRKLRLGDHICTDRNLGTYFHHGIFIGGDRVIHFGRVSSEEEYKCFHGRADVPNPTTTNDTSGVRKCCLECFLRGHSLYRFEYGKHFRPATLVRHGGSYSTKQCDDVEVVLGRATKALEEDNFDEWALATSNCETFAYFCQTGVKYPFGSKQVLRGAAMVAGATIAAAASLG